MQVLYLGRAPRTKETLPNFREICRVIRHSRVFRRLTGSQRTPGFWGVTSNTYGNKRKYDESSSNNYANFKKNKTCFFCGKNDPFKKECRFYKRLKTKANARQKKANIVERPPSPYEIIAMIIELKIIMIT